MDLDTLLRSLGQTPYAVVIRENGAIFPWIESVHVLALTLVLGLIALVDLRLTGLSARERPIRKLLADVLPSTWVAFAVAVTTGVALFASNPLVYAHNAFFLAKLGCLGLLGLNALGFHTLLERVPAAWGGANQTPLVARISGVVSILLWLGVAAFGRWIGFTLIPVST